MFNEDMLSNGKYAVPLRFYLSKHKSTAKIFHDQLHPNGTYTLQLINPASRYL